jgi:uncharacterized membrane protein YbhN (UPF0104 family)
MNARLRRWWPVVKVVLAVAILALVGVRFARDLDHPGVRDLALRPVWLVLAALLYLAALAFSAWYWYWLLWRFGEKPGLLRAVRAYYVGHLGKYIPGKALALVIRGSLIQSAEVKFGVAIITAFYEVLTTMASGALVAALLFTLWPPRFGGLDWDPVFLGLLLVVAAGIPLLPGVFNRLVRGLARRFQHVESFRLPQLRMGTLLLGLAVTAVGWLLAGLSVWALLQALCPQPQDLDLVRLARFTAATSLSYVAGFMALVVPGGVGVREYILLQFLPQELAEAGITPAEPLAAVAILVLRLVWTAAEVGAAVALYCWPGASRPRLTAAPALSGTRQEE